MLKKNYYAIALIVISIIVGLVSLPFLPAEVPTHFSIDGTPDSYSSKYIGVFLGPIFMILIYSLLKITPKIDPKKQNYRKFKKNYQGFNNVMITFFFGLQLVTIAIGLGYDISIEKIVTIGIGLLFVYLGNILPQIKQNYFYGIRTPWTLDNEEVWRKTHRIGGKIMFVGGILILCTFFLSGKALFISMLTIVIVVSVSTMLVSYLISKKIKG